MFYNPEGFRSLMRKALIDEGKELKCAVDSAELYGQKSLFFINETVFRYGDNIYRINDIPSGPCVIDMDDWSLKPVGTAMEYALLAAWSNTDDLYGNQYEDQYKDMPDRRRAYLQSNILDCQDLIQR